MAYCKVNPVPNVPCISEGVDRACKFCNVTCSHGDAIACVDIVLRADVNKAEDKRWKCVTLKFPPLILVGDVVAYR